MGWKHVRDCHFGEYACLHDVFCVADIVFYGAYRKKSGLDTTNETLK